MPGNSLGWGRLLLVWRLAAGDVRRHPVESVMVFVVIAAAAAMLTVSLALSGVTNNPYQQTRMAAAGPDVIADVGGGGPAPVGGQASGSAGGSPSSVIASLLGAPGVTAHSGPYPYVYSTVGFGGHRVDVVAEGRDEASSPVDQPKLTQGAWLRPGGVVVEAGFADALGVQVGDRVTVGDTDLRVTGIAVTAAVPSYPSSLCHLACGMAVPQDMGLVWVTRSAAGHLGVNATTSYLLNLKLEDPAQAPAFVARNGSAPAPGSAPVLLYTWQSIRGADGALVQIEQVALQFGGWLLGLLALAGLGVLVGRRMTEQTRRVGLLKAVGATPATVAVVLLAEHLVIGAAAGAGGLLAGWLLAPLLTGTGSGLLGGPGAPSIGSSTLTVVAVVALGVPAISSFIPALRASRTSTSSGLADGPRVPPRRPRLLALSARLPAPLLLAVRQFARRPRRALLNAASIMVTVTGIVAILASYRYTHPSGGSGIVNLRISRLDELMTIITIMLAVLAGVNTTFIAWATAADARFSSALERALGATGRQVATGLCIAAVLPAVPAALAGLPLGVKVYHLLVKAQSPTTLPVWQLAAVFCATLLVVAGLTALPSLAAARRPPAEVLQTA
jgi:ABC-type lipoprotein release transport system permease subunit